MKKPKIYLAHSSKYDFQSELYQPIKQSALMDDYDFVFLLDTPDFLPNTKELIKSYDAVVAEIGYPTTGAGIEIGWADAFGIPLIFIHKDDFKPAAYYYDMGENIISYVSSGDMIEKLQQVLKHLAD